MTVRVLVPSVQFGAKMLIEVGARWSSLEHLVLFDIREGAASISEIVDRTNLPAPMVVRAITRLMEAAWVEIRHTEGLYAFVATRAGRQVVGYSELPSSSTFVRKWLHCTIELATGQAFKLRDLSLSKPPLHKDDASANTIRVQESLSIHDISLSDAIDSLLRDNERLRAIDYQESYSEVGKAEIVVHDNYIEKPRNRTPELDAILFGHYNAVMGNGSAEVDAPSTVLPSRSFSLQPKLCALEVRKGDLIFGGPAHRELLSKALVMARTRMVIHSTFLSTLTFKALLPQFKSACLRGVEIDVLWGDDMNPRLVRTLREFGAAIESSDLKHSIRICPFSTNSHAKILLYDDEDGFRAVIGSCNWLRTSFRRFEASVLVRSPSLVSEIAKLLERMLVGHFDNINPFRTRMAELAASIDAFETGNLRSRGCIIAGTEHAEMAAKAFRDAHHRILFTSDKISGVAESSVFASATSVDIPVSIYYSRPSGGLTGAYPVARSEQLASDCVKLSASPRERIHAKVLAWDNNHILITSMNWLSKDVGDHSPLSEIGVYLQFKGCYKLLEDALARAKAK